MRNSLLGCLVAAVAACSLVVAASASAATEVGSNCTADNGATGYAFLPLAFAPGSALPISAPTAGVVTRWRVNSQLPEAFSERMKVVRPTSNPNEFTTVAETGQQVVGPGPNAFDTRIPVLAGDRFGVFAPEGAASVALVCVTSNTGDSMGALKENVPPGTTKTYVPTLAYQPAVSVLIEPDADSDGYGDETQDLCPQSAASQAACPIVILDAISQVGRGSVVVLVATSHSAPVKVTGTVKLGKDRRAALKSPTQTVTPGKLTRFKLNFPTKLKDALKELEPKQKLTLKITASATNIAGQVSTDKLKAKLKGQG